MRRLLSLVFIVSTAFFGAVVAAVADDALEAFYGAWAGIGVTADADLEEDPVTIRETDVTISPVEDGFEIRWTARPEEAALGGLVPAGKTAALRFVATPEPGFFEAKGGELPLGPGVKGVAEVTDGRLLVIITETTTGGETSVARYERTVSGNDMRLKYTLTEASEVVRKVSGNLRRLPR
ncbi:MAG: hypothetical protein ACREH3_13825 [Geminicoccales bacterium]